MCGVRVVCALCIISSHLPVNCLCMDVSRAACVSSSELPISLCVEWDVKLYSLNHVLPVECSDTHSYRYKVSINQLINQKYVILSYQVVPKSIRLLF